MVRKRENGIYYTSFRLSSGERIRRSTFTKDYEAALKYALKEKEKLELELISTHGAKSWRHAVLNYSKKVGHKRSWPDMLRHIQYLDTFLCHIEDLNDINRDLVEDIKDAMLGEGVKGATVNRYLTTFKSVLRSAYDREWNERIPKIEMLPESRGRTEYLNRDEYNKLVMALSGVTRQIVKFATFSGLRAGNVFNLKWKQVDLENELVMIASEQYKGDFDHTIPLNEVTKEVLQYQYSKSSLDPEEHVFLSESKPIHCIRYELDKACKRANIKHVHMHMFRHTLASWLSMEGASSRDLMELMGWASESMVKRYTHLNRDHLRKISNKVVGHSVPKTG